MVVVKFLLEVERWEVGRCTLAQVLLQLLLGERSVFEGK